MLRDYQQDTLNQLFEAMATREGNPCLIMPTGAGKSHMVAAMTKQFVKGWSLRVLMLTHVKELIEQNYEKMLYHWPGAPAGIYSASVGGRCTDDPIIFGGVQSVINALELMGFFDVIIVDECDLVNHEDVGRYRDIINFFLKLNPNLKVIGLTATPWRMGYGVIYDDSDQTIFDYGLEPYTYSDLVEMGYLAPLKSKASKVELDLSQVKKRGGEFIESQLNKAVNVDCINQQAVDEIIKVASEGQYKHWLIFCAGVEHSKNIADLLCQRGIVASHISGKDKATREPKIEAFKAGKIQAMTNVNLLTVGFDFPDIDFIVFLRPTMSPRLYVQMAGRGTRLKSHTDYCRVLDIAGLVKTHGPLTCVNPPKKKGEKEGDAPVKICPECDELVHLSVMTCPSCSYAFPKEEKKQFLTVHNDCIMGGSEDMLVTRWKWQKHISKRSNKLMLKVTYYGCLSDDPVDEYLPVYAANEAGHRALVTFSNLARNSCAIDKCQGLSSPDQVNYLCDVMNEAEPPLMIEFIRNGRFKNVIRRHYDYGQDNSLATG